MIEVELKKETPLDTSKAFCACGKPATRTVTIGRVEYSYGHDYQICESNDCLEGALDDAIEDITYIRTHRHEFAAAEQWNLREGK